MSYTFLQSVTTPLVTLHYWVGVKRISNLFKKSDWASLSPVYTIQPVVKPVVNPVWQPGNCLYTRYNQLSNPLSNRLYRVYKHSTDNRFDKRQYRVYSRLSNRLYNRFDNRYRFDNRLYRVYEHSISTGCKTGLTTCWMFVYTIQPVVKPVVQPAVSCKPVLKNILHRIWQTMSQLKVNLFQSCAFSQTMKTFCIFFNTIQLSLPEMSHVSNFNLHHYNIWTNEYHPYVRHVENISVDPS